MASPATRRTEVFEVRRYYLIPLALVAAAALAQEEEEALEGDLASPEVLAFTVTDGSAPSKEIESAVGKMRGAFEEKPVLFLTINLASEGAKNQSEMLFSSLGLGPIWDECRKSTSQLVLVRLETVTVLGKHGAKENLSEALGKHLAAEEEGCEEGEEGGCDGEEGCGG
jgi:hypothetical protein